ncbi:MAG: hemerythrin domain-containing protein [Desulfovibrionaceae bacterium]|nr:hemerythrin domain-containing protein [Desulfovibrionaceae bacterium]MBF0513195.1 hemerythrin domain-containing protein [Desulfovibrionaceae bacterium]
MSVIDWDKRLSIGIQPIDEHHKNLIGQMNNIALAAELLARPNDLAVLLRKLRTDMRAHFDYEEKLMDPLSYPQFKLHRNEHRRCEEMLADFHDKLMAERNFSLSSFLSYVANPFNNHVACSDQTLGDFIRRKSQ